MAQRIPGLKLPFGAQVLLAMLGLVVTGCQVRSASNSSDPPSVATAYSSTAPMAERLLPVQGWVASGQSVVMFIQWTEADGRIEGQFQQFSPEPDGTFNTSVTGTHSGSQVSLVTTTLGSSRTITGTLDGDALTLVFPLRDGSLGTATLLHGSVANYNAAVRRLQDDVRARQAREAAAQAALSARAAATAKASSDAAAHRLAEAKELSCAAIGGRVDTRSNWCTSTAGATAAVDCSDATVSFNADGTIWRGRLEVSNIFKPGCFQKAATVPTTIAR